MLKRKGGVCDEEDDVSRDGSKDKTRHMREPLTLTRRPRYDDVCHCVTIFPQAFPFIKSLHLMHFENVFFFLLFCCCSVVLFTDHVVCHGTCPESLRFPQVRHQMQNLCQNKQMGMF